MKKIAVIGSTGSIGRQALSVAARYPERFCVVAMAANSNQSLFAEQVASVRPAFAVLRAAGISFPSPQASALPAARPPLRRPAPFRTRISCSSPYPALRD